ncbi:MAG TPA: FxsA family protein [Gammaproteobacteria bacterium]|nr:FxsA family protein [Gammaproteobacteria bacterium]
MNVRLVLLVVFLVIPLTEIYLLIEVGGIIGAIPTIFLVVFTAVFGALLIRQQGVSTMLRARQEIHQGMVPAMQMLEGAALLVSGALLLTPGFLTDTLGFVLLVPPLRRFLILKLLGGAVPPSMTPFDPDGPASGSGEQRTIEGEFKRDDD